MATDNYDRVQDEIFDVVNDRDEYQDIIADLDAVLVDRYFCNFSLFQSLPDSWAIDQLFPIMPIHRLDEEPVRRGTLQDVTCDSDGKIDRFVGRRTGTLDSLTAGVQLQETTVELHKSLNHRWWPKGVYRFRTHAEADAWMMKMLAQSDLPKT